LPIWPVETNSDYANHLASEQRVTFCLAALFWVGGGNRNTNKG
jgi:hypothetical protein